MDVVRRSSVTLAVTPRILSDVLLRELLALDPAVEVVVGRDAWGEEQTFDIAVVSESAECIPAPVVVCLPGPADAGLGTVTWAGRRRRVLLDSPVAVLDLVRCHLTAAAA